MVGWADQAGFLADIDDEARRALEALKPMHVPARATLFRPGDAAQSFVILLSGRIGVYLTGRNGRELLLYSVTPARPACRPRSACSAERPIRARRWRKTIWWR
ncbi:cyclic nucleotide-binding domain-containing protein [Rhizobium rosettiformans]|uniref:cyclic nucleotide-binding domain-containing protein n=1 Tax=Rhizobium rosettiformans TaxID=1368430 RepID=UPI00361E51D0